jgi:hypothetical protein
MVKVGVITQKVIDLLDLDVFADTPIFLSDSNIEHMAEGHPEDFEYYGTEISNILKYPDYIGQNPSNKSIEYVKIYKISDKTIKIAVRVSSGKMFYARTMYSRNIEKIKPFIEKGYLIKY